MEKYIEFNPKTCSLIINETRTLVIKELLPLLAEGDTEGVRYENGTVNVPESFHGVFNLIKEGDWNNVNVPAEMGGQGAPVFLGAATAEYFLGANWPLFCYATMGGGTAIGHPLGATGIRLTGNLVRILNAKGGRYGCVNACVGGGQGVATIIEREEYEWC
jgi:alkylation response protein AidB-like acyl-CoA dehydrogenase